MAKKSDYFGLSRIVSLILAIIPFTAWVCGVVTRISEGKILAGVLRIIFGGWVVWVIDLVMMVLHGKIWRLF
ncbi:MAG: hypothetical protein IJY18_06505 [Clostridia bacterium]|nr:hypothetical protein [Clostridia bacterium]